MSAESTVPHGGAGVPITTLKVEVLDGPDRGLVRGTASESLSIGTAESNDLVLRDDTVSRYHLELSRQHDRILVRDHGSTNGTFLGTSAVERARIVPGTTLRLGRTTIRVGDGEVVTLEVFEGERLGGLIGRSDAMRQLMARTRRAAQSDVSVLILGETGTGKEVVARTIHEQSRRAERPFETVDCGAILPTLIASELFGHEKGSFTGADRQHLGAFERAQGGTLFLDEIGELPLPLQAALLGALERRSFRRVGGTELVEVDVRVVAATHRDLREAVNAGSFRQDLYYRLAVLHLHLPPLRERLSDLPLLAAHFLKQAGHGGPLEEILPPSALEALALQRWPGNLRELKNVVEAAMVMGEAPVFEAFGGAELSGLELTPSLLERPYNDARAELVDHFERRYIRALIDRAEGNVSKASRMAQMNRAYLTKLLKRHGLHLRRVAEEEAE
ncbi:MAG: sigma 54-dependent Fis family transcriptional regulator [Myxococcota bacterium]